MDFQSKTVFRRFTAKETHVLVREVRARQHRIYGTNGCMQNFNEVRKTWDEIAKIVSAIEGVERTGEKCRKRFNDFRRRGSQKTATLKNMFVEIVEKPPTASKHEEMALSPECGGHEFGLHEAVNVEQEHKSDTESYDSEEDSKLTVQTPSVNALQSEDQPFLDLQQSGFNMLESELRGVQQVMASLHTRLKSMEMLLQPIEHISYNMERIANAVDSL